MRKSDTQENLFSNGLCGHGDHGLGSVIETSYGASLDHASHTYHEILNEIVIYNGSVILMIVPVSSSGGVKWA